MKFVNKAEKKLLEAMELEGRPVSVISGDKRRFAAAKKLVACGLAVWDVEPKTLTETVPLRNGGFGSPTIWVTRSYVHGSLALPGYERKSDQ